MDIFNKKIVFHIHTKYSHDCNLEPALIVDTLFKGNISAAIITDHNSIQGAIEPVPVGRLSSRGPQVAVLRNVDQQPQRDHRDDKR